MDAITKQVEWIKKRGLCGNDQLMKMMKLIESQEHAIAEKDREIQQIREHEYQRGYQEAEEKYQQLMEKAVRFAKVVSECWQSDCNQVDTQEYEEAQAFLKEHHEMPLWL